MKFTEQDYIRVCEQAGMRLDRDSVKFLWLRGEGIHDIIVKLIDKSCNVVK